MTHDDTQMMADDADGNPPATPWCYPHLGETRGYSKAVTFSLSSRRCRGKWVRYEAGASVEVAPVDALGSGGWGQTGNTESAACWHSAANGVEAH